MACRIGTGGSDGPGPVVMNGLPERFRKPRGHFTLTALGRTLSPSRTATRFLSSTVHAGAFRASRSPHSSGVGVLPCIQFCLGLRGHNREGSTKKGPRTGPRMLLCCGFQERPTPRQAVDRLSSRARNPSRLERERLSHESARRAQWTVGRWLSARQAQADQAGTFPCASPPRAWA